MVRLEYIPDVADTDQLAVDLLSRRGVIGLGVAMAAGVLTRPRIRDAFQSQYDVSPREKVQSTVDLEVTEVPYEIDLIRSEAMAWDEVPGVYVEPGGLRLKGFNPTITNKRSITREQQKNPPLNMNLLRTNGGFAVTAGVDSDEPVHVQLYGGAPIRQDDFRHEFARLDCEFDPTTLRVREWYNDGQGPIMAEFPLTRPGYSRELRIETSDADVLFYNGADLLGHVPANDMFEDGNLRFGLNVEQGTALVHTFKFQELEPDQLTGIWNASAMRVRPKQGPTVPGYLDEAGRDLAYGTAASVLALYTNPLEASVVLGGDYRTATLDNGLKWQDWDLDKNTQDARYALAGLRLLRGHGMGANAHTGYYKKSNPVEFEALPADTDGEKSRIMNRAVDHIVKFGETFGPYIDTCDVTCEIMDGWGPGVHMEQNAVYRAMGMQGIALLYRTASEVMPKVKLGLNEYGFEIDPFRTRRVRRTVDEIRGYGGRVDYVGSQTHIYHESGFIIDPVMWYFLWSMREADLEVHFSEVDVTDEAGIVAQMKQFQKLFRYALGDDNVKRFATWGSTNYYGSKAGTNPITGHYEPNTGLPIDKDFHRTLISEMFLEEARRYASGL